MSVTLYFKVVQVHEIAIRISKIGKNWFFLFSSHGLLIYVRRAQGRGFLYLLVCQRVCLFVPDTLPKEKRYQWGSLPDGG